MRILIVEDEYSLADALREILKKEKYTVDISDNGQDGLYQALTGIYDAVVLDVMLSEMNGFEVLQNMRAEGIKTPVLMLTAKSGLARAASPGSRASRRDRSATRTGSPPAAGRPPAGGCSGSGRCRRPCRA